MCTCFGDHMFTCLHALVITCSNVYKLGCSNSLMITCPLTCITSCSYAWTIWWLHATVFKCFYNFMLTSIDIHSYDIHTHLHTHGCQYVYRLGGLNDHVVGRSCAQTLWRFCFNAEVIGRLKVCALGFLNAHMLVYSNDRMLVCSHDQMLVYFHS